MRRRRVCVSRTRGKAREIPGRRSSRQEAGGRRQEAEDKADGPTASCLLPPAYCLLPGGLMQENGERGPGQSRPRRLLLCLDGVPHELIETAKQRGLVDGFRAPARLLSPFPTMTNIALSAMFGATPPHGYESLYFDKTAGHLRGGVSKYIGRRTPDKIPSSYMD